MQVKHLLMAKKGKGSGSARATKEGNSVGVFCYVFNLGTKQFDNLLKHVHQNGIAPRVYGHTSKMPKHAFTFSLVKNLVAFVLSHSKKHGLPRPAYLHGRDGIPPVFLLASTFMSVHKLYISSSECQDSCS